MAERFVGIDVAFARAPDCRPRPVAVKRSAGASPSPRVKTAWAPCCGR